MGGRLPSDGRGDLVIITPFRPDSVPGIRAARFVIFFTETKKQITSKLSSLLKQFRVTIDISKISFPLEQLSTQKAKFSIP